MSARPQDESTPQVVPEFDPDDYRTRREVPLRCAQGAFHGAVVNGRYLRLPCRRIRTKDGVRGYHVFDLVTGHEVRIEFEPVGRDSRQGVQ